MLRRLQICGGRVTEADAQNGQIIVVVSPDEAEKKYLVDELKIDEHTLASAMDPDEVSRIEYEPEHVALILKRPKNYSSEDNFLFKVSSLGFFLFKDRLVVAMAEDVPLFEGKSFLKLGSVQDVALKLIYRTIFHFLEHLKVINAITDSLEHKISQSMENRYLLNLFTLEKSLVYYLNALNGNGVVIEKLKNNAAKMGFSPENVEFLDDVVIENNQCYKQAEIYSNILAGLMDARASIVNNNLNLLIKTLNIITIGIMVPTLVVSAFSMNVDIPLAHHRYAFWIIMGFALLSVMGFMLFWRRKKW